MSGSDEASPRGGWAEGNQSRKVVYLRGTEGSNPSSSSSESVSPVPSMAAGAKARRFAGSVSLDETREWDVLATSRLAFSSFL